ncbi:hypothetical protein OGZ02_13555 [Brachyspira hyodysenteriae]|nr:NfeD family protein [Brachyspira hyodysenteriae]MDA1469827.1 hypothetical protein [Brachyspira hyodysenteriae]
MGFGITGILGIIGIFSSIFISFGIHNIAVSVIVIFASLIIDIILIFLIAKFVVKSKDMKRTVILTDDTSGYNTSISYKDLLNKEGIADTYLRPSGFIIIDDKKYDAVSDGEFIDKGSKLKVILTEGSKIVVKKK